MKGYVTISDEDKNNILQQHSTFYNGYATGNVPSGPQPLKQDMGPLDSNGINVNNRGEVSTYKNHMVNESTEEVKEYDTNEMDISSLETDDFETELEFDRKGGSDDYKDGIDFPPSFGDEGSDFSYSIDFPPSFGDEESDFSYSDESYSMDIDSIVNMFDGLHNYDDDEVPPPYEFESEDEMDVDLYEEEQCEGCESEVYEGQEVCEMCGSEMREGECMECGGMYEDVDEDLRETFLKEKNRISEMFDRFKKFL